MESKFGFVTEPNKPLLFRPVFERPEEERKLHARDILREILDDPHEDAYL